MVDLHDSQQDQKHKRSIHFRHSDEAISYAYGEATIRHPRLYGHLSFSGLSCCSVPIIQVSRAPSDRARLGWFARNTRDAVISPRPSI